jgi:hypothetical protein
MPLPKLFYRQKSYGPIILKIILIIINTWQLCVEES